MVPWECGGVGGLLGGNNLRNSSFSSLSPSELEIEMELATVPAIPQMVRKASFFLPLSCEVRKKLLHFCWENDFDLKKILDRLS